MPRAEHRHVLSGLLLADTLLVAGISVAAVIALALAIPALISVFRNPELSGAARAAWVIIIALLPIVGSVIYFGVRSDW